jgi:hypothetical protein
MANEPSPRRFYRFESFRPDVLSGALNDRSIAST